MSVDAMNFMNHEQPARTDWRGPTMQVSTQRKGFAEAYDRGEPQVVWTTLVADLETPVAAMIKLAEGQP